MHLSLHWHGAEGLYTVKKQNELKKKKKKLGLLAQKKGNNN